MPARVLPKKWPCVQSFCRDYSCIQEGLNLYVVFSLFQARPFCRENIVCLSNLCASRVNSRGIIIVLLWLKYYELLKFYIHINEVTTSWLLQVDFFKKTNGTYPWTKYFFWLCQSPPNMQSLQGWKLTGWRADVNLLEELGWGWNWICFVVLQYFVSCNL